MQWWRKLILVLTVLMIPPTTYLIGYAFTLDLWITNTIIGVLVAAAVWALTPRGTSTRCPRAWSCTVCASEDVDIEYPAWFPANGNPQDNLGVPDVEAQVLSCYCNECGETRQLIHARTREVLVGRWDR